MKIRTKIVVLLSILTCLSLGVYIMNTAEVTEIINQNSEKIELTEDITVEKEEFELETEELESDDDITGHWAETELNYFYSMGLLKKSLYGLMFPDSGLTRSEFITLFVSSLKLNGETEIDFLDIWENDTFYNDIKACVANGVLDNGEAFRPYEDITAKEASDMINKALGYEGGKEIPFVKECFNKNSNYEPNDFLSKATIAHTMYTLIQKFSDSGNAQDWIPQELEYLLENKYLDSKWSGILKDNKKLSRKVFVKLASEALGVKYEFKNFNLDDKLITREEMSMVLTALLYEKSKISTTNNDEIFNTEAYYLIFDADQVSKEYYDSVMYTLNAGILKVNSRCDFNPKEEVYTLDALKAIYQIKKYDE